MTNQTDDRGRRLEEHFHAALELPPAERDAFVQREAGDDPDLAAELRALIAAASGITPQPGAGGASTVDRFHLVSGTKFGDFRILQEIGAGGMGAVYLATDLKNDRLVALKVMKPMLLTGVDHQRFEDEAAALARLEHANIARLYFSGVQPWQGADRPFFVMEYVDGKTLDKFLEERQLSTRQSVDLLRKISLAVHHGHLKGVFHRDLKPLNILVTADAEPKIIDFGVSFMVSTGSTTGRQTRLRENAGTPIYMAPEAAGGGEYVPDPRTDVYGVGVIAFEVLARRRPGVALASGKALSLEGQSAVEVRRRIAGCERETLGAANRAFRGDLELVIAKALRLKISDRYADASELAGDFRRLLSYEPISARPGTRLYRSKMFLRRNWLAATATAAVFLAIVAAAVVFRVDEARVKAALNVATERGQEIARQNAAGHARTALLAEQRGNWAEAAKEYQAAEAGHFPDRLALAVGELRALSRQEERRADADALVVRVHKTMPEVAQSPRFQVVEGFFYWSFTPEKSAQDVRQALVYGDELPPADRAFAEALLTDDIRAVAKKLRESVGADPFNRDAWGLLALCDLALGEVQKCEQDAGVMQRLYPGDGVGTVLAAIAAAFQGRRLAAIAYVDGDRDLPPQLKETLIETVEFVAQIHSTDDLASLDSSSVLKLKSSIFASANMLSSSHALPIPLTFSRLTRFASAANLLMLIQNPQSILETAAAWPNGDGEYAAGLLAMGRNDYALASQHFREALASPCLIDCRRRSAFALVVMDAADSKLVRHVPPAEGAPMIKADLDRLISLGGVYPEKSNEEIVAVSLGAFYELYPQVRTLALTWLARVPDDPRAMYYLACANVHVGDSETALALYKRALANGLAGEMKNDAEAQVKQLTTIPATQPATRPTTMP